MTHTYTLLPVPLYSFPRNPHLQNLHTTHPPTLQPKNSTLYTYTRHTSTFSQPLCFELSRTRNPITNKLLLFLSKKMGLQNQLTDVSSESIPILLITLLANSLSYLRSLLFIFLSSLGLSIDHVQVEDTLYDTIGSGLAGVVMLAEQLSINKLFSYTFDDQEDDASGSNCVVCLNKLDDGDHVRKLECRHVFHKECFDGWLDTLNFNCPICRSPLVSDERVVELAQRRVAWDLLDWFSLR